MFEQSFCSFFDPEYQIHQNNSTLKDRMDPGSLIS